MPQQPKGNFQLSEKDRKLLTYFFWFSLLLSLFLLLVRPSGTTIGIVLSVITLGAPLFKNKQASEDTDKSESTNSPYALSISRGWWLFLAITTFGMPFVFGWTPAKSGGVFFVLAFFGLAIGTIILAVAKFASPPARKNLDND